jgi:ABC-2 type transport system ATP-binding protein
MGEVSLLSSRDLHVTFPSPQGPVKALQSVNLEIPSGALFVLLGPNGAGKTTLMRCITGLVKPTQGTVSLFNTKIGTERSHLSRLGILIENPGLYGRLSAKEYLEFFGSFYAIKDLVPRIHLLSMELGFTLDGKPIAKLSQGNRQKLQLIRSLLHRPHFLLWDEPTDHLDPVSQKQVLEYLRRYLHEEGATALVATHRLEQMEMVASHFGFLAHGEIQKIGTREDILGATEMSDRARLGFARTLVAAELQGLENELGLKIIPSAGGDWEVIGLGLRQQLPQLIRNLVKRDLPLVSVEPLRPRLSDAYERWIRN